jgi:serine/threonine protein kinase
MKRLNHPNLVKLHAVIEDPEEGKAHLVMQYVDNGPIGKVAPDNTCRPLPFTLALKYMAQVARGLEYLHSQNIIHRDMKPENILIGSDDTAYLLDFGVSSIISDRNRPAGMVGTMSFFSPELLASHSALEQYGKESDVWAFGVTLYCLLFGKLPFTGHTGPELMRAILMDELVIPDYFPEVTHQLSQEQNAVDLGVQDDCPFLSRHSSQLQHQHHQAGAKVPVPQGLKLVIRGLLSRDPSGRLALRTFRHNAIVRRPERYRETLPTLNSKNGAGMLRRRNSHRVNDTHPLKDLPPTEVIPPKPEDCERVVVDAGAIFPQIDGIGHHEELEGHRNPSKPDAAPIEAGDPLSTADAAVREKHPDNSSSSNSSASHSSDPRCLSQTADSFLMSFTPEAALNARAAEMTSDELSGAITQCNVVLHHGTGRSTMGFDEVSSPLSMVNAIIQVTGPSSRQGEQQQSRSTLRAPERQEEAPDAVLPEAEGGMTEMKDAPPGVALSLPFQRQSVPQAGSREGVGRDLLQQQALDGPARQIPSVDSPSLVGAPHPPHPPRASSAFLPPAAAVQIDVGLGVSHFVRRLRDRIVDSRY